MATIRRRPQNQAIATIRRGGIYLVTFDPTVGHEIQKTRPALVIQNDIGNRYGRVTIVSAITSKVSPIPYPVEVLIEPSEANGLEVRSAVRLDQVRSVDRQRLIRFLGTLDAVTMAKVNRAIQLSLGLIDL